uniref:Aminotransferase class I/classII large domain-containing protein n=1 Tax=Hucho hucho TaxID=62062 RepID=A0A4W5MWV9_9TELE
YDGLTKHSAVCPLDEMCDVSHDFGAITFVDEVHAVGLYGAMGGIGDRDDMLWGCMGALDFVGGYIVGTNTLVSTVRSYAASSSPRCLPCSGARESIQTLKGEEGRVLRRKHQRNVKLLHQMLMDSGHGPLPQPHHPCQGKTGLTKVCDIMSRYNIYVQAINYPMVAQGEEGRIAPTPHHTPQMMQYFFHLVKAWKEIGLELKLHSSGECNFCQQPLHFELMTEREKSFFTVNTPAYYTLVL